MNNEDIRSESIAGEIPQRAVSLYGQNEGIDDFPVLKAFQQYIDAEQEKARKRIIGLSVFFFVILAIVVAVFLVLLNGINIRNQTLSDRLVEYAMRESDRRQQTPVVAPQQSAASDEQLKAMTSALLEMQRKFEESVSRSAQHERDRIDAERNREEQESKDKLAREKQLLEIERKKISEEKERLRQLQIEQQRRRLYPDLYENGSSLSSGAQPKRTTRTLTDDDIREIIREAYPVDDRSPSASKNAPAKETKSDEKTQASEDVEDAIEYFKDEEYRIPVDVKGSDKKVDFVLPME